MWTPEAVSSRSGDGQKNVASCRELNVAFQLVDTASADETIILKWGLEKYTHVCGVDVTGLKRIHVCNEYPSSIR